MGSLNTYVVLRAEVPNPSLNADAPHAGAAPAAAGSRLACFVGAHRGDRMRIRHCLTTAILAAAPMFGMAAEPVPLRPDTYKSDLGVLIIQVNWGRTWKCGRYENSQLEALTFRKVPPDAPEPILIALESPSKLFVDNKFLPHAFVIQPGEYYLAAFDVKVARSVKDVGHLKGAEDVLVEGGKPVGGSFTINPGEIVYVGHFGLDCGQEPFLWRYYLESREEFEKYVQGFREEFPFVRQVPVQYRLFSTRPFGNPFSLKDPIVK